MRNKLFLLLPLIAACSTHHTFDQRKPSSDPRERIEDQNRENQNQFYLKLIPAEAKKKIETTALISLLPTCQKWPGDLSEEARSKKLLDLWNRPFYFFSFRRKNDSEIIGRLEDIRDLACSSAGFAKTTEEEKIKFPLPIKRAALKLPNANFQILELMIGSWSDEADAESFRLILDHKDLNIYNAEDLLKEIFKLNSSAGNSRTDFLAKFVKSTIFNNNKAFFVQALRTQIESFRKSSEEKLRLIVWAAGTLPELNQDSFLSNQVISLSGTQSDTYPLFQTLAVGMTEASKADLLLSFLQSELSFSGAEKEFANLMTPGLLPKAFAYSLNKKSSFSRISRESLVRVFSLSLQNPSLPKESLSKLMYLLREPGLLPPLTSIAVFKLFAGQTEIDQNLMNELIYTAAVLKPENEKDQMEIFEFIHAKMDPYFQSPDVANGYFHLLRDLKTSDLRKARAIEWITKSRPSDDQLLYLATTALKERPANIDLLKSALKKEELSLSSLQDLSKYAVQSRNPEVLRLIETHPKADAEIKARIQGALDPAGPWKKINASEIHQFTGESPDDRGKK